MPHPPRRPLARSAAIAAAIEASRLTERERLFAALDGVQLRGGPAASLEERFLTAELAYLQGHLKEAIAAFEAFEDDPRSGTAPDWQRFASAHRRTFAYLHLGYSDQAERLFPEAERRLQRLPIEERRLGELDAMRGHLLEQQGDYERARARFVGAFNRSIETGSWRRAATSACDVASMHLRSGQLPEADEWLNRAEEAWAHTGEHALLTTILTRRGHVRRVEGKLDKARDCYDAVIASGSMTHPDAIDSALRGRAEVFAALGDRLAAEADLQQAVDLCLRVDNRDHAAYALRDLANLYLDWEREGDDRRAIEAFAQAMRLALSLRPPQPGTVMDFSEEVLRRPALIGGTLPIATTGPLRHQTAELRSLTRPHPFAQTARAKEAKLAFERLLATFQTVARAQVTLRHRVINLLSGRMNPPPTPGKLKLTAGELEVLRLFIGHQEGLEIETIAEVLDISLDAASRRVMRLRQLLAPDLQARRKGNDRLYALHVETADA